MKIYDGFIFFNELDILEIRLNTLYDVVDHFILVESSVTHAGHPKEYIFEKNKHKFENFLDKIIHLKIEDTPDDFTKVPLINGTSFDHYCLHDIWNFIGKTKTFNRTTQPQYGRDFYQKESIRRGMYGANDEDVIIFSDVDEIPNPYIIDRLNEFFDPEQLYTFEQNMYCYYFNLQRFSVINNDRFNRELTHVWKGSRMGSWGKIKNMCMNDIRAQRNIDIQDGGWHFSYMGGKDMIEKKIKASSAFEWNNPDVLNNLEERLLNGEDVIRRGDYFQKVPIDYTYPEYFVNNQEKFKHLIKT